MTTASFSTCAGSTSTASRRSTVPAAVVPINCRNSPLPIGVQVIGPYLEDRTMLAFAAHIEREFGGFVPPPDYL